MSINPKSPEYEYEPGARGSFRASGSSTRALIDVRVSRGTLALASKSINWSAAGIAQHERLGARLFRSLGCSPRDFRRARPVGLFCLHGRPHLKLVGVPTPEQPVSQGGRRTRERRIVGDAESAAASRAQTFRTDFRGLVGRSLVDVAKKRRPAELIPLTVAEIRRLLARLVWPVIRESTYWHAWSRWRRRHQPDARRHHCKSRGQSS